MEGASGRWVHRARNFAAHGGSDPRPHFVASFADGVPGYIPPSSEYPLGGYEVLEAHRYYGLPAAFAPGSAERLEAAAIALGRALDTDNNQARPVAGSILGAIN